MNAERGSTWSTPAASAATALLGMSDSLDTQELDELEAMIARARRNGGDDRKPARHGFQSDVAEGFGDRWVEK